METDRRHEDKKIDEMFALLKEVHQRQVEFTIPLLEKINNCVFGNGKKGLTERVTIIETERKNNLSWVNILIAIGGLIFVGIEAIRGKL